MDCDVVGGSFLDSKRAIVRRREGWMNATTTNEDVCSFIKAVGDVDMKHDKRVLSKKK